MKDGTYHREVYFPDELKTLLADTLSLRYTMAPTCHYQQKARQICVAFGAYKTALCGYVVEAQVENNKIVKLVTRIVNKYRPECTLCFAVQIDCFYQEARVKTVWENRTDDKHFTLNENNYVKCEKMS